MLRVVCWKWVAPPGYRSIFTAKHVNTLRSMVERHYKQPHEFVCITDDWRSFDSAVRVIPLWKDLSSLQSPHGELNPSCYRRLRAFSREAGDIIGERFVSLDLDVVIVDDVAPLWDRPEDFVIWGDKNRKTPYNGSMWLLRAGTRTQVWDQFDPIESPILAKKNGFHGSDQAWISYLLKDEAQWTPEEDGVVSFRIHVRQAGFQIPKGARIVFFNGHVDPWSDYARVKCPWIDKNYL